MVPLDLYKQEVKELTELLGNDWADIREIAMDNGLNINNTYLRSLMESVNDDELYLFYEKEKGFFLYEKHTTFKSIDKASLADGFPQIQVLEDLHSFDKW